MSKVTHYAKQTECDVLEPRRLFAVAGTLDSSFGTKGIAYAPAQGELQPFHRVRVDSAGRTVGVGETASGEFYVARLNVDGTTDTSFGPYLDGVFIQHFGSSSEKGGAWDLAFQSDGKIVVVGEANRGNIDDDIGVVIRLNTNGTLDKTFDGDGIRTYRHSDDIKTEFRAVKVLSSGKILVGGTRENSALFSTNIDDDFIALRFNSNGSLDKTFDQDGIKIVAFGDDDDLSAMAVDSVGRIVLVGTKTSVTNNDSTVTAIARLTANGAIDKTFDGDGKLQISYGNERTTKLVDVIIQDGDKIVVAGTRAGKGILLARFLPSGSLDQSFSGGWKLIDTAATEKTTGLLKSWDNEILLSANSTSSGKTHAIVYKLTANGSLDASFGVGGLASLSSVPSAGPLADLGLGSHRFVMPAGTLYSVARILDTGSNVVYAATFNPITKEAGPQGSAFVVYRQERLPYATRVYLTIGGTAGKSGVKGALGDYTLDGVTIPRFGTDTRPYVEIPANATFATVTVTPVDDSIIEPTETIDFSIQANAAYDVGTPSKVSFTIADNDGTQTTKTLHDTADAYVYDGSANTNYGSSSELVVKNGGTSLNRYTYLKFDLSSVSSIGSATLRLYGKLNNTNQTNVKTGVHSSGVTNWSESAITWNNKPTVRTDNLGEITVANNLAGWYEVDLTTYLRAEKLAGRNTVTLVLTNPTKSDPYTTFGSDESANRPELVIGS